MNSSEYRAEFTNGCGSSTSCAATLTVNNCPTNIEAGGSAGKIADGSGDGQSQPATMQPLVLTVHPNPATNLARICVEDLPADIPVIVMVVDARGATIATLYDATPDAELGLCLTLVCSRLASGTYYARIMNDIMGSTVKLSVVK